MSGSGPAPKENRRRRNADTFADVQARVTEDDQLRGPALEGTWSAQVRGWYDIWRRSPQAATFLMTDWMRLRMVAPLLESYLESPTAVKLAEIRQNESLLGATHVDRLKARIKVEREPEKPLPAGVTAIDEYRNALGA